MRIILIFNTLKWNKKINIICTRQPTKIPLDNPYNEWYLSSKVEPPLLLKYDNTAWNFISCSTFSICDLKSKITGLAMERISAELKKPAEYGIKQFAYVIKILVETGACDNIDNQYINWDALNRVATYRVNHSIHPEYW